MKLLNKISTYSLVAASSLALTLSSIPEQANAINLVGQNNTAGGGTVNNFKGQTFTFTDGGGFSGTTRPGAIVNNVKFALNATNQSFTAKSFVAYIYDVTSANPSVANINTGFGSLATSGNALYVAGDGSFTGTNNAYLLFTFTGPLNTPELVTASKTYGIFFSLAPSTNGFVTDNNTTGVRTVLGAYAGGTGFRENPVGSLADVGFDAGFIIDATPVPFEFEATGGIAVLGGLFLANKLRKRNQKVETDEQA